MGRLKPEALEGCGEGWREAHSGRGTEFAGSLSRGRTRQAQGPGSCGVRGPTGRERRARVGSARRRQKGVSILPKEKSNEKLLIHLQQARGLGPIFVVV